MPNPIVETTEALMRQLDAQTIADARASVRVRSLESTGEQLGLEESINLLKGAKYLASADGLSNAEETGLKLLLRKYGMPERISEHVLEFDVSKIETHHIGELAPPRSRRACFLLSGMIAIAGLDGLSDEELADARKAGAALGLEPKVVALIVAEAKASVYGVLKGDRSLLSHLMEVRRAIFALVED
jgi:tellurite resistance protein